jgi:hypothetical protein
MEWVDDEDEAELIITDSCDDCLSEHAEFAEDLLTTDLLEDPDTPVQCFRE